MSPSQRNFFIGGLIILVAGIVQLMPQNSCEKSSNKLLVLVDQTDVLSDKSLEAILNQAKYAIEASPPYTNVVVKYISDGAVKKRYEGCRPEKVEWYSQIASDDQKLEKKWKEFVNEFLAQLNTKVQVSESSPIYEVVIDDARIEFINFKHKDLLIFSDFRQFTKDKINLQTKCSNPELETQNIMNTLPTLNEVGADNMRLLDGVHVKRFMIPREDMSKDNMKCLVMVSDMVFQNLMSESSSLDVIDFLPISPASTGLTRSKIKFKVN